MSSLFLFIATVTVAGSFCLLSETIFEKKILKRIGSLERDLQAYSDMMSAMADVQTKIVHQYSSRFEDLEERIMDLSIPSHDANLPLERRRQVLALARQGAALEDITKRLKAPAGEAELILNLQKYMDREIIRPGQAKEQAGTHA
jgi:hypothetical protein